MSNQQSIRGGAVVGCLMALVLAAATVQLASGQAPPKIVGTSPAADEREPDAQPASVLDLIPDDAALAIGIPNIVRLKERGDHLFAATNSRGIRLSEIFRWLYDWLNVDQLVDEERPAAAILVNIHDVGLEDGDTFESFMETLVIHVPVADIPEAAKRFKLTPGALAEGTIVATGVANSRFACLRGDYLLLAWNKRAIESVLQGDSLAAAIPANRRPAAEDADVLVLAGTKSWGKSWERYVDEVREGKIHLPDVPRQDEIRSLLQKTVPDARFALVTVRIDDGIQLRLFGQFHRGGTAEEALVDLGSRAAPASLAALPQGNLLTALAASGPELASMETGRLLLPVVLDGFSRPELIVKNDPRRMLATFDAIRPQIDGCRIGLYATGATTATELSNRGSMAAVFVLDTGNPEKLTASLARDGIALGGSSDEADGDSASRIPLRRVPDQQTIGGHAVDRLEIDTSAIEPETSSALREAFGPAWMVLRAAHDEARVVVLLGSQVDLLEETLGNLDASRSGVLATGPFEEIQSRMDTAHQAALYLSLRRTLPALTGFEDAVTAMNQEIDRLSAFAMVVEDDAVQVEVWLPLAELQALPEKWRRFWY